MKDNVIKTDDYKQFIQDVKHYIQTAQIKAAVSVNRELLNLYWDLAKRIIEKQKQTAWGDGFIKQMSIDLQKEFPDMKGFSKRNLELMRKWYHFWSGIDVIAKQPATQLFQLQNKQNYSDLIFQIPWWHNVVIITKIKNIDEAIFYVQKTIQNNWSRAVLTHHIESGLYTLDLICKSKNNTVVEYALKDIHKPIGVSEYIITRSLPDEFKSSLPSIEEIEAELGGVDE